MANRFIVTLIRDLGVELAITEIVDALRTASREDATHAVFTANKELSTFYKSEANLGWLLADRIEGLLSGKECQNGMASIKSDEE